MANVAAYIAHGQRKQNMLPSVLFSGKWEACFLVHNPEHGQGFGNLKWRSCLHTSTQHHLPYPSLQLWAQAQRRLVVTEEREEWESGGGRRGLVAGCQQGSPYTEVHTADSSPDCCLSHHVWWRKQDLRKMMLLVAYMLWQMSCNSLSCTMLESGGGVFEDIFNTGAKNGRFHNEAVVQLNVNHCVCRPDWDREVIKQRH